MTSEPIPMSCAPVAIDRRALAASLSTLEGELRGRIGREEGRAGLLAVVLHAAPRYLAFVETLRTQHRDILSCARALRWRALTAPDRELTDVVHALKALRETIVDHEALEREILRDALEG
jgi:hypothetical protein